VLRDHALLTPAGEGAEYRFQMTKASARAEVRVRPKLAVDDPAVLHSATVAGLGIGLLPEFLCRQGVATAKLRQVLPTGRRQQLRRCTPCFPPVSKMTLACAVSWNSPPRI
jgi:DNA-binding transcriptional LysR family regulator